MPIVIAIPIVVLGTPQTLRKAQVTLTYASSTGSPEAGICTTAFILTGTLDVIANQLGVNPHTHYVAVAVVMLTTALVHIIQGRAAGASVPPATEATVVVVVDAALAGVALDQLAHLQ